MTPECDYQLLFYTEEAALHDLCTNGPQHNIRPGAFPNGAVLHRYRDTDGRDKSAVYLSHTPVVVVDRSDEYGMITEYMDWCIENDNGMMNFANSEIPIDFYGPTGTDTEHYLAPVKFEDGARVRRFDNAASIHCSAIYSADGDELALCERYREQEMINLYSDKIESKIGIH